MKFVKGKLGRISIVLLFIVFGLVLKTAIHNPVPKHFEENVKIIDNSEAVITLIEPTGILSEIEEVMEQGPVEEDGPPVQFSTLQAVNPDIVGWIRIAGTQIDYPIVQAADNDKYLHTGFNGKENVAGSIFLDYESQSDFAGKNTVLYGHNMKNGTMFKDIVKFKNVDYFKEHQYFVIYTPDRTIHLKAIACYYDKADVIIRRTEFQDDREFQEFVQDILEPCRFLEMPETSIDQLYTLVTCSYEKEDARTYLFAIEDDHVKPDGE